MRYEDDPESHWVNPLFAGGYEWMDRPAEITKDGVKPYPNTGARAELTYSRPSNPDGLDPGNWIQTVPERGWFQGLVLRQELAAERDRARVRRRNG
jgi:hypothetical protein